jgi:uncharacterized protein YfaS (alpha-2-macroglobulin family)
MNRVGKFLLVLFCGFALVSVRAGTTGRMNGMVKDAAGIVVAGASVSVTNEATGISKTSTTDRKGVFGFVAVLPGNYKVRVEAKGFTPLDRVAVVHVDSVLKIDLTLEPAVDSR